MDLQEAIKSGKPFSRKGWAYDEWFESVGPYVERCGTIKENRGDLLAQLVPSIEDLLADDWVTKEELLTISKEQLYEAIDGHPCNVSGDFTDTVWEYLKDILKEELSNEARNQDQSRRDLPGPDYFPDGV